MSYPSTPLRRPAVFQSSFVCALPRCNLLACWLTVAFLTAFAVVSRSAAAEKELLPAIDDSWRRFESPHFEMFSQNSESESRELLHKLELLRAYFLRRFKAAEKVRLDVSIFYFKKNADFRGYTAAGTPQSVSGYYAHRLDRAVIVMAPTPDEAEAQSTIFHEYIHHLFRSSGAQPPRWYNEGMAELLSTVQFTKDVVEIGHPAVRRALTLQANQLLPLEQLFGADDQSKMLTGKAEHMGIFYSQAWALLHYWYFGESGVRPEAVERFLAVAGDEPAAKTADLPALFKSCFGMDYREMESRLRTYVETGRYRHGRQPLPDVAAAKTYLIKRLSRTEVRPRLAELALRVQSSEVGRFMLLDELSKTPAGGKKDPRLLEALGTHALFDGDLGRGRRFWEDAVAAGSRNVAIARELILLETNPWFQRFDPGFRLPDETTTRFRTQLIRAIEEEPEQAAAYETLAWVEAFSHQPAAANVVRVQQKFSALKEQARTMLALSFVRVRLELYPDAEQTLDQVDQFHPDAWTANAAQIVRAQLASLTGGEVRPAGQKSGSVPEPVIERPKVRVPSVELPEGLLLQ